MSVMQPGPIVSEFQPIRHNNSRANRSEKDKVDLGANRQVHWLGTYALPRTTFPTEQGHPSGDILTPVATSTHDIVVAAP
jgi:hypothetical protein